ncbi:nucleotide-diphospho-sugar transferase [Larkinella bovis]|uniref:Nucleotide-diphospho-sugar transferase n=1 Tax=Larkinella bovis TaxID=683041 RepID=A0ABW0IHU7_9BACT
MLLSVPILFVVFNKVEETKKVFNVIRSQKPLRLFIASDGPRLEKKGESEKCQHIRGWILDNIDWECEVKTLFRDFNAGCGRGPSDAITWFFQHVDEGIILEDDCLPNESFFRFCGELLNRYRDNEQVSIISGNNFQPIQPMPIQSDYYFSVFPSSNGWATWKRSWQGFDFYINNWPTINKKSLSGFLFTEKKYSMWWLNHFQWLYNNRPNDMWDFQFHYLCMVRKQLAVIPRVNLVKNIGYGPDATHSQDPNNYFANVPTHNLSFPLIHPNFIDRNIEADIFIQRTLFGETEIVSYYKKLKRFIKSIIRKKISR